MPSYVQNSHRRSPHGLSTEMMRVLTIAAAAITIAKTHRRWSPVDPYGKSRMDPMRILPLQFLLSLLAYSLVYWWFVGPWLRSRPLSEALMILVLPHTFRHLGVNLLVPGLVDPGMPESFALKTALGDLLTVALAVCALFALRFRWNRCIAVVWIFNMVGCADLLLNLYRAVTLGVAPQLGAAWYVPAFVVPGMLVAHIALFEMLITRARTESP